MKPLLCMLDWHPCEILKIKREKDICYKLVECSKCHQSKWLEISFVEYDFCHRNGYDKDVGNGEFEMR